MVYIGSVAVGINGWIQERSTADDTLFVNGFLLPLSARRAAELLVHPATESTPRNWRTEETGVELAGEIERLELVLGIAERLDALRRAPAVDSEEIDVCRRLLEHLSAPAEASSSLQ